MTQPDASSHDAFNDSLNFVKKLWGGMNVPGLSLPDMKASPMQGLGMPIPSMSVEDLDKRIAELKTVENWLTLNMTMLRNTIQALEIQRATIAALHSLSSTMAQSMHSTAPQATTESESSTPRQPEKSVDHTEGVSAQGDETKNDVVSPLINQSAVWWNGVQEQFKLALAAALANSTSPHESVTPKLEQPIKPTKNASSTAVKSRKK